MTTIRNEAADGFVNKPPPEIRLYLVHGNDEGLIHERAKALVETVLTNDADPLRLLRIEGDALAAAPGRLPEEVYAISMFGGHRVLWIDVGSRDLAPVVEPIFARPPQDCTLVLEAGALRKGTALRTLFERSPTAASIECYPDERLALLSLIDAAGREAGLEVGREAREHLVTLLGADRQTSRGEVGKLMLYARGSGKVELADVEAIVSDAAPSGVEALIDEALSGNLEGVERAAGRYFSDGGDVGLLLARLVARVLLLRHIRLEMEQGKTFDAALQGQFVRLSTPARAALARQAERWTSAALGGRLSGIRGVVARARRQTRLAPALATRALWTLAQASRGGRG